MFRKVLLVSVAVVMAAAMLPIVPPSEARERPPVLTLCRDRDTLCDVNEFPQGAPWAVFQFVAPTTGVFRIQVLGADGQTLNYSMHRLPADHKLYLTETWIGRLRVARTPDGARQVEFTLPVAGPRTAVVTDVSVRPAREVARAEFVVTPQMPPEALEAFRDRPARWERMGFMLAAWRLGDIELAERTAQQLLLSADGTDRFMGHVSLYEIAASQGEWDLAAQRAQARLDAGFRHHNDWVDLIRALTRACRLDEAQAAAREAMREHIGNDAIRDALRDIFLAECPPR
jgi:hypothetical protein